MILGQTKARAATALAAVFLAGVTLGAVATKVFSDGHRSHPSPEEYRARLLRHLTDRLGLDEHQQAKVEEILDDIGERFGAVRDAMEPELEAIRAERGERIMSLLDQDQRAKYGKILEERARRRGASPLWHPRGR